MDKTLENRILVINILNGSDKGIYPTIHSLFEICTLLANNTRAESFSSLQRFKVEKSIQNF